jgi:mannosyltransferase OCH1-like enzyme
VEKIIEKASRIMIPKVVHMTYKDLSKLPFEIRAKNIALEEMNSDFEFRYYDDLAMFKWIVDNCTLEVRDAFLKIDGKYGAAKADFFRYLLINQEGGIYLDIKSTCNVPFKNLIHGDDSFVTSHWTNRKDSLEKNFGLHLELLKYNLLEFQQWFLISSPDSKILNLVISEVTKNLKSKRNPINSKFGRTGVLELTGPIIFTKVLSEFVEGQDYRLIESDIEGLEYSIYSQFENIDHHLLFTRHYSKMYRPITIMTPLASLLATFINIAIKQFYKRLRLKIFMMKRI